MPVISAAYTPVIISFISALSTL